MTERVITNELSVIDLDRCPMSISAVTATVASSAHIYSHHTHNVHLAKCTCTTHSYYDTQCDGPFQKRRERRKKNGRKSNGQKWKCLLTDYILHSENVCIGSLSLFAMTRTTMWTAFHTRIDRSVYALPCHSMYQIVSLSLSVSLNITIESCWHQIAFAVNLHTQATYRLSTSVSISNALFAYFHEFFVVFVTCQNREKIIRMQRSTTIIGISFLPSSSSVSFTPNGIMNTYLRATKLQSYSLDSHILYIL